RAPGRWPAASAGRRTCGASPAGGPSAAARCGCWFGQSWPATFPSLPAPMSQIGDPFLGRLAHLFKPVDGWGECRTGARPAAVVTNFSVVPFVAYRPDPVESFVHDPSELEGILAITLDRLLDDSAWLVSDDPWRFRYLAHEESRVWGLTERIVYGLAPKLRQ